MTDSIAEVFPDSAPAPFRPLLLQSAGQGFDVQKVKVAATL